MTPACRRATRGRKAKSAIELATGERRPPADIVRRQGVSAALTSSVGSGTGSNRFGVTSEPPSPSMWHTVELADDCYGVYNLNWGCYLESLRLFCTTGAGKPFRADEAAR
jgi:hypothetical protein